MSLDDVPYYSRLAWARLRHALKLPALCLCAECDNHWLATRHAKMSRYVFCPECHEGKVEVKPWEIVLKVPRH